MSDVQQKFSLWLNLEQALRFSEVMKRVKSRNRGRAEFGEVMRELMNFPLKPGVDPLLTAEDRAIIAYGFKEERAVKKSPTG